MDGDTRRRLVEGLVELTLPPLLLWLPPPLPPVIAVPLPTPTPLPELPPPPELAVALEMGA